MKIVVGTDEQTLNALIAKKFGYARYYLMYDTDDKTFEVIENIDPEDNHAPLRELVQKGADVFIVSYIGPHAFEVIHSANKKIFHAKNITGMAAIEKLERNELEEMQNPNVKKSIGHHHNSKVI
jgi:predicted Fe-Mo cluster-binding NifX family protein